jgi:ferritin
MMLDDDVKRLLNEQVNKEFYSAYLYLDMANYYQNINLAGFANYFTVQAQEERDHAMLFITYLLNNGETVTFSDIKAPGKSYGAFDAPLTLALEHEEYVTASIHAIYEKAALKKDFRTMQFLDWFIKEQGEEEKSADDLIKKYRLFGADGKGLYMLDSELAARVYAPPALSL